jgi:hypothetical protein
MVLQARSKPLTSTAMRTGRSAWMDTRTRLIRGVTHTYARSYCLLGTVRGDTHKLAPTVQSSRYVEIPTHALAPTVCSTRYVDIPIRSLLVTLRVDTHTLAPAMDPTTWKACYLRLADQRQPLDQIVLIIFVWFEQTVHQLLKVSL